MKKTKKRIKKQKTFTPKIGIFTPKIGIFTPKIDISSLKFVISPQIITFYPIKAVNTNLYKFIDLLSCSARNRQGVFFAIKI